MHAQVRGKTVYLQYSTRQEIVNSTRSVEQGGNVLLVSLENLLVGAAQPPAPDSTPAFCSSCMPTLTADAFVPFQYLVSALCSPLRDASPVHRLSLSALSCCQVNLQFYAGQTEHTIDTSSPGAARCDSDIGHAAPSVQRLRPGPEDCHF